MLEQGNSIDPDVVTRVRSRIRPGERVILILDSKHTKDHVLGELRAYAPLVSVGSYAIAMDGAMERFAGLEFTGGDWEWNNPHRAAVEYVRENPDFVLEKPGYVFNEGKVRRRLSYCLDGLLKRVK
jgi:cephalosporin hydroxylase